ncbi:cytochrome P450 4C1-like [Trichoplusia ni]|uniref:Cytochrome P450 4C1-like n=1 Tax=Trichoplusia ni TaxID=7111 RepID=A0A7E5WI96_TRINI|nr:cytochrome P450 4C1-like [Trichoplusia ni]
MLPYLIGTLVLLCVINILLNYNERARLIKKIPGPKDDFLFGNALTIIRSPVEIMKMGREFAATFDGIFRLWIFPYSAVVIYNPEDVEIVMSGMKHSDKSIIYSIMKPWLRDGLLLSKGEKWHDRRKILTPAFHFNILKQYCEIFERNSERLIDNLKRSPGKAIDVVPVLSEFTLHSICETSMGTQLGDDTTEAKSYKNAIYDLGSIFYERLVRIYLYVDFLFYLTPWGRKQKKHLKAVHSFTENVIEQRKEYIEKNGINFNEQLDDDDSFVYKKKKKTAMLDLLLSAEKDGLIDREGINEEVDTFMFEGHDTTASGLTFFFMALANHRNIQDKIVDELKDIFGETKRPITMDDLSKMKYLECCIKESLRMYPPVHFISRNISETTVLSM